MKPACIRWQFNSPLSDSPSGNPQMPVATRSNVDLTNFQKCGKMPAHNLLRLNSIGEHSPESFSEPVACKAKLGYSRPFDSISPLKSLPRGIHTDNGMKHSAIQMGLFSAPNNFRASPHNFWAPPGSSMWIPGCPFGMNPPRCQRSPYHPFSPFTCFRPRNVHNSVHCQDPPRIPGPLPGALCTAMSSFSGSPKPMPPTQGFEAGSASQTVIPQNAYNHSHSTDNMTKTNIDSQLLEGMKNLTCKNTTCENLELSERRALLENKKNEACLQSIASCVDKLSINDSVHMDNKQNEDQEVLEKELQKVNRASNLKDNGLKRRKEKTDKTSQASGSNSKCSLTSAIDFSNILFLRKTPKKGRPSCKKRKKRQHQATSIASHANNASKCEIKESLNVSCKHVQCQSQCASPAESSVSSSSALSTQASQKPHDTQSPSKPRPSFVAKLFCSPNSDSELSDNDMDECDSVSFSCDLPKSLSPLNDLGSSLSFDTLFKPKKFPSLDTLLNDDKSDPDQENRSQSPVDSSPGAKTSVHFSLSFRVSDDEDSDRSYESFSSSPSEHLFVDVFEFGNGLSLEAILGSKAKTASCPSKGHCTDNEKLPSVQVALLGKINADWNKSYPSVPSSKTSGTDSIDKGKVQFASKEDLVQTHIVGNEERRGTWREDRERFLKRIEDIGKVVSHVFTNDHRQKIRKQLKL